jgi:hypothetical protein
VHSVVSDRLTDRTSFCSILMRLPEPSGRQSGDLGEKWMLEFCLRTLLVLFMPEGSVGICVGPTDDLDTAEKNASPAMKANFFFLDQSCSLVTVLVVTDLLGSTCFSTGQSLYIFIPFTKFYGIYYNGNFIAQISRYKLHLFFTCFTE